MYSGRAFAILRLDLQMRALKAFADFYRCRDGLVGGGWEKVY